MSGLILAATADRSIAPKAIEADAAAFGGEVLLRSRAPGATNEGELPTGSIRAMDASAGIYLLEWQGRDGKAKRVEYVRPDTVSVLLPASVTRGEQNAYRYSYVLTNLERSGQFLSGFVVQTHAGDVRPLVEPDLYVGRMGSHLREFPDGAWYRFGNDVFGTEVVPGRSRTIELESDAQPGIVECKVHGGPMRMIGAGEEIPEELEALLPGYAAWPSGLTIGPNDRFGPYGSAERYRRIRDALDRIVALGWLHGDRTDDYREALAKESIGASALSAMVLRDAREGMASGEFVSLLIDPAQRP